MSHSERRILGVGVFRVFVYMVEAGKLEHGFRRIRARIPYSLP